MAYRNIETQPSKNIQTVLYEDDTGNMVVQFVRAGTSPYLFKQVPLQIVEEFTRAPSAGQYFRGNVLRQFPYEKIEDIPAAG